jgi:hypothetical protein
MARARRHSHRRAGKVCTGIVRAQGYWGGRCRKAVTEAAEMRTNPVPDERERAGQRESLTGSNCLTGPTAFA